MRRRIHEGVLHAFDQVADHGLLHLRTGTVQALELVAAAFEAILVEGTHSQPLFDARQIRGSPYRRRSRRTAGRAALVWPDSSTT